MKNINFRIIKKDKKIKFAGTGQDSWFDLETAKKLIDRSKGEIIYEYCSKTGNALWEVL